MRAGILPWAANNLPRGTSEDSHGAGSLGGTSSTANSRSPSVVPAMATRAQAFDELVLDAASRMEHHAGTGGQAIGPRWPRPRRSRRGRKGALAELMAAVYGVVCAGCRCWGIGSSRESVAPMLPNRLLWRCHGDVDLRLLRTDGRTGTAGHLRGAAHLRPLRGACQGSDRAERLGRHSAPDGVRGPWPH